MTDTITNKTILSKPLDNLLRDYHIIKLRKLGKTSYEIADYFTNELKEPVNRQTVMNVLHREGVK